MAGLGKTIVAAFAVERVLAFGKSCFDAFEQQEKMNRRLLFSVKGNTLAFNELTKQAEYFQQNAGIDDDVIEQIQQLGANTGKTTEQIKKITEAAVQLSTTTGQDLQASYIMLNMTLAGNVGRLGRIDRAFTELSKTQLENGAAIDLVLTKYKGFAENSTNISEKVKQNWGETKELIGKGLSVLLDPLLEDLNEVLRKISLIGSGSFKNFAFGTPMPTNQDKYVDVKTGFGLTQQEASYKKLISAASQYSLQTQYNNTQDLLNAKSLSAEERKRLETRKKIIELYYTAPKSKISGLSLGEMLTEDIQKKITELQDQQATSTQKESISIQSKINLYQKELDLRTKIGDLHYTSGSVELLTVKQLEDNIKITKERQANLSGQAAINATILIDKYQKQLDILTDISKIYQDFRGTNYTTLPGRSSFDLIKPKPFVKYDEPLNLSQRPIGEVSGINPDAEDTYYNNLNASIAMGGSELEKLTLKQQYFQELIKQTADKGEDLTNLSKQYKDIDNEIKHLTDSQKAYNSIVQFTSNVYDQLANSGKVTFKSLIDDILKAIEKEIAMYVVTKAIKSLIGSSDNENSSSSGSGTTTGGQIAMTVLNVGMKLFGLADGGMAYGKTTAVIGEYAGATSNPEVVAPLSDLKKYMNPGIGGRVVFKLHGNELQGVLDNRSDQKTYSN
jgi:hypothetical protein